MTVPAQPHLKPTTIDYLQDLIQVNLDSYNGLTAAAERVDDDRVAELLQHLAKERSAIAAKLSALVAANAQEPHASGTLRGRTHRVWMRLRSALNGGDPLVILIEAERCENHVKETYEEVLENTGGSPVGEVLLTQYYRIRDGLQRLETIHAERTSS